MTRSYFAEPLITRLNRMMEHARPANNTYALRKLPSDQLHWGSGPLTNDGSGKNLCVKTKAVTVWIVGEVKGFRTKDFQFKLYIYNAKHVVVGVVPFLVYDRHLVRKLMHTHAMPSIAFDKPSILSCRAALTMLFR